MDNKDNSIIEEFEISGGKNNVYIAIAPSRRNIIKILDTLPKQDLANFKSLLRIIKDEERFESPRIKYNFGNFHLSELKIGEHRFFFFCENNNYFIYLYALKKKDKLNYSDYKLIKEHENEYREEFRNKFL